MPIGSANSVNGKEVPNRIFIFSIRKLTYLKKDSNNKLKVIEMTTITLRPVEENFVLPSNNPNV